MLLEKNQKIYRLPLKLYYYFISGHFLETVYLQRVWGAEGKVRGGCVFCILRPQNNIYCTTKPVVRFPVVIATLLVLYPSLTGLVARHPLTHFRIVKVYIKPTILFWQIFSCTLCRLQPIKRVIVKAIVVITILKNNFFPVLGPG